MTYRQFVVGKYSAEITDRYWDQLDGTLPNGSRLRRFAGWFVRQLPCMTERPIRVLFLCTHNSARSQMAEGLLRAFGGADYEVFSAGTEATRSDRKPSR